MFLLTACDSTTEVVPVTSSAPPPPAVAAALSVSPASIELQALSGTPVTLTVINFSKFTTATAISATLPVGWTDVTQDSDACATLAPQSSCTLTFTPGASSHPSSTIVITGQNAESTSATIQVSLPNTANLSLAGAPLSLVAGSATAGIITVTNNSLALIATDIVADLSGTVLQGAVIQDASSCVVVMPGASCSLSFMPQNTALTLTSFPIHGDNTAQAGGAIQVTLPTSAPISIAGSPLILQASFGTAASGTLTVTNDSTVLTASNISANLSATALASALSQDSSDCVSVAPGASCTLTFTPITSSASASTAIVVQGANTSQAGASIAVNAAQLATLSVSPTSLLLTPGGTSDFVTITNTSATTSVSDIEPNLTGTALAGNLTVSANTCSGAVPPASSCTITFSPGSNTVATTSIPIAGAHSQTVTADITIRTLVVGDSYAGGIVYQVPAYGVPGMLVTPTDMFGTWTNSSIVTNADSETDGAANTATIVAVLGSTASAAGSCYSLTDGNANVGTWYLPADDELIAVLQLANGGAIDPMTQNFYWASTENTANPPLLANSIVRSNQALNPIGKSNNIAFRCIRAF
jgi:hypothetical protein